MPLHLIKLAVGAASLADLQEWMAERMAEAEGMRRETGFYVERTWEATSPVAEIVRKRLV